MSKSDLIEAAGEPVRFKKGGEEYIFSPLTVGDTAEIERWAEEKVLERLTRRMEKSEDPEVKKLLRHRLVHITNAEVRSEAREFITSNEATPIYVRQMLRQHHDLDLDKCAELITPEEFDKIYSRIKGIDRIDKLSRMEQELLGDTIPKLFAALDDPDNKEIMHPADLVAELRKHFDKYRKALIPDSPREDA